MKIFRYFLALALCATSVFSLPACIVRYELDLKLLESSVGLSTGGSFSFDTGNPHDQDRQVKARLEQVKADGTLLVLQVQELRLDLENPSVYQGTITKESLVSAGFSAGTATLIVEMAFKADTQTSRVSMTINP